MGFGGAAAYQSTSLGYGKFPSREIALIARDKQSGSRGCQVDDDDDMYDSGEETQRMGYWEIVCMLIAFDHLMERCAKWGRWRRSVYFNRDLHLALCRCIDIAHS